MKNNLLYSLFFLLLFTACSKENEENIRPIIDLPCEEQGTYFLSATIGDSVLCYASDSAFDDRYGFGAGIRELSNYIKDTSTMLVQIHKYNARGEYIKSIQYDIPIYANYQMINHIDTPHPFYNEQSVVESFRNKFYYAKDSPINDTWRYGVADFGVRIFENNYNAGNYSYLGSQDSSYIHLYNPRFIRYGSGSQAIYNVDYDLYIELYDIFKNYLYPFKAKGTFQVSFFILN